MANNEVPEPVIVAQAVTKDEVMDAYIHGDNYYELAQRFLGSQSEDALERIRQIVEG